MTEAITPFIGHSDFVIGHFPMYELFEHTADLGLRVQADSLDALFIDAARGLLAMFVANPKAVRPVQTKTITLTADDSTYLLFDWLSELLYAFETEKLLLSEFDLQITDNHLTAACRGEPMDPSRHHMDHEVKAITYHGLKLTEKTNGWHAEVIVDI
jgi:SHS2 domain-containing protein